MRGVQLRAAAALFAVAYSVWLLEFVLPNSVAPAWAYVSELAARSEPLGWVFARGDTVAGLLAALLAWLWWRRSRLVSVGFLLWGLGTFLDSLVRMSGTETIPGLWQPPVTPHTAGTDWAGIGHIATSSVAQVGLFIAVLALIRAVPALHRTRVGLVFTVVCVTLNVLMVATSSINHLAGLNLMMGLWQRLNLLCTSAFVVAASWEATRPRRVARFGRHTGHAPDTAV